MSAAAISESLRITQSLRLHEWIDPHEEDTLGIATLFLQSKEEFMNHTLLQMQRAAAEKNINYHLIGEGEGNSYHITPIHIWRKIKGTEESGKFKKKKNAEDLSKTAIARLVSETHHKDSCLIAEYNMQKLFCGKRGIVTVYDLIKSNNSKGKPIYTIYTENYNLGDLITCEEFLRSLDDNDLYSITEDIILGVQTMHAAGYAHCDIKPENIVLNENSEGKLKAALCDFGMAKKIEPSTECKVQGTAEFVPPEKLTDSKWLSEKELPADIWSLGLVFYIIHTRGLVPCWYSQKFPFRIWETLLKMAKSGNSFVTQKEANSKPELKLIQKMCQYNPKNRPTIDQVYQEFKNCLL